MILEVPCNLLFYVYMISFPQKEQVVAELCVWTLDLEALPRPHYGYSQDSQSGGL